MKIKSLFPLLFLMVASPCFAQQAPDPQKGKIKREVNGYTIRIVHNDQNTYGYLIYKDKEHFVKQLRNPYTQSTVGLKSTEDAFKTAEWIVKNIIDLPGALSPSKREYTMLKLRQRLPEAIATRLKVDIK